MLDFIKKYWPLIAVITFLIGFGSRLQAIASAPNQVKQTSESVDKLANSLDKYVSSQEEYKKFLEYRLDKLEKEDNK